MTAIAVSTRPGSPRGAAGDTFAVPGVVVGPTEVVNRPPSTAPATNRATAAAAPSSSQVARGLEGGLAGLGVRGPVRGRRGPMLMPLRVAPGADAGEEVGAAAATGGADS